MTKFFFRVSTITICLGNLVYLIIVYSLWKSIFASSPNQIVNGMTFKTTFIYLAMSKSMYTLFLSNTEWNISSSIIDGKIIMDFLKPMNYQLFYFLMYLGSVVFNFLFVFIPSIFFILFAVGKEENLGFKLVYFLVSLVLAMCISFIIDFFTGTVCFFTESTWGISILKEVIVLLLSGAIVPIPFFPDNLKRIVEVLPFHAIYNLPVQILTNSSQSRQDYLETIGIQIMWIIILFILSRLFYKRASKVLTINGG